MAKGQKYIVVDGYALGLLQEIVNQGKASDVIEAVEKSAAAFLSVRHKPKQERKMEQEAARITELGKKAIKEG